MALLLYDYVDALPDTSDLLNQKLNKKPVRLRIVIITLLIVSVIAADVKPIELRIKTVKMLPDNLSSGKLATSRLPSPEYVQDTPTKSIGFAGNSRLIY